MGDVISRRRLLASAVGGVVAAQVAVPVEATAAEAPSVSAKLGKATPVWNGFEGVTLHIIAADDFSPVGDVLVSLTFIGASWAENSTSQGRTNRDGQVTFHLTADRPGPYLVGLKPVPESRYCVTNFSTPETMLTILPDGRYFPQIFRIGFRKTEWKEMREAICSGDDSE